MIYPRNATLLFPQICENGEVYKNAIPKNGPNRLMDLKIDYAFKMLFGDERNKKIIIAFLNAFFTNSDRAQIQNLEFQNKNAADEGENTSLSLFVETEDKEAVFVEILFPDQDTSENQSLYFWSKMYRRQFEADSDLESQHSVVTISIMNFEIFHESDEFHSVFRLSDKDKNIPLTNLQENQFVEIPKLIRSWKQGKLNLEKDTLARWLLLLAAVDAGNNYFHLDIYKELEKLAMVDQDLNIAMKYWGDISNTEKNQLTYQDRYRHMIEQHFLKEIEKSEEKRQEAEERATVAELNYNQMKNQYKQQKIKLIEEREKRIKAEENAVLANREAAKVVIRYGKVVARNLFEQGMDNLFVKNITGMSDKETAMIKEELDRE